MVKALRDLGHEVSFYDPVLPQELQQLRRTLHKLTPGRFAYRIDEPLRDLAGRRWLKSLRAFEPDLIAMEGCGIPPWAIAEAAVRRPVAYWFTFPPGWPEAMDSLWQAKQATHVFSMDRAWKRVIHYIVEAKIFDLPFGGDPDDFYPLDAALRQDVDVVYVGSLTRGSPDGLIRAYWLERIAQKFSLAVFGQSADSWGRMFPRLAGAVRSSQPLAREQLNQAYGSARIVLNIHTVQHEASLSARTFDIALAGAFQIGNYPSIVSDYFPGDILPSFDTPERMIGLIEEWLRRPEDRAALAAQARREVKERHTWKHRAEAMLATIATTSSTLPSDGAWNAAPRP